jgi:hypothetical protein
VQSGVLPLRPLTLGELLDAAVALLRGHARVFLAAGAVLAAAEQAVLYPLRAFATTRPPFFIPYGDRLAPYWLLLAVGFGLEISIIALLGGLTARAAGPALFGEQIPTRRLLAPGGSRLGGILLISGVAGLVGTIAALACLVPWFVVYAAVGLAVPALVIDRVGPVRAVTRSAALAVRGGLRAAGVRLTGYIAWWAVRLALGIGSIALLDLAVGGAEDATLWLVAGAAWAAVNAVAYPALACLDAVLHLETRMRTEGLDIALSRARVTGRTIAGYGIDGRDSAAILAVPAP